MREVLTLDITSASYKVALVEAQTAQGENETFFVSDTDEINETIHYAETGKCVSLVFASGDEPKEATLKVIGIYKAMDMAESQIDE